MINVAYGYKYIYLLYSDYTVNVVLHCTVEYWWNDKSYCKCLHCKWRPQTGCRRGLWAPLSLMRRSPQKNGLTSESLFYTLEPGGAIPLLFYWPSAVVRAQTCNQPENIWRENTSELMKHQTESSSWRQNKFNSCSDLIQNVKYVAINSS